MLGVLAPTPQGWKLFIRRYQQQQQRNASQLHMARKNHARKSDKVNKRVVFSRRWVGYHLYRFAEILAALTDIGRYCEPARRPTMEIPIAKSVQHTRVLTLQS